MGILERGVEFFVTLKLHGGYWVIMVRLSVSMGGFVIRGGSGVVK